MIFYLLLFINFILINSYSITFPSFPKNKAIISNIDIKNINNKDIEQLNILFNKIPVIIFKNQKLTPNEYYKFIKLFDNNYNSNISLHSYNNNTIPSVPQVELICKNSKNIIDNNKIFKNLNIDNDINDFYNYLWHQDVTGSYKYISPIISSMYMLVSPLHNDDTLFASYEDAYDLMDINLKKQIERYNVIHSNSKKRQKNSIFDYTGLRRDINYIYDDDILTENPFVVYSDKYKTRKTFALNPKKFLRFKELSLDDSYNLYRHIMKKYVIRNDNIISHHWEDYDLCIFNNRKLIHTSSPKCAYNNERIYLQCRLATNEPIYSLSDELI